MIVQFSSLFSILSVAAEIRVTDLLTKSILKCLLLFMQAFVLKLKSHGSYAP